MPCKPTAASQIWTAPVQTLTAQYFVSEKKGLPLSRPNDTSMYVDSSDKLLHTLAEKVTI